MAETTNKEKESKIEDAEIIKEDNITSDSKTNKSAKIKNKVSGKRVIDKDSKVDKDPLIVDFMDDKYTDNIIGKKPPVSDSKTEEEKEMDPVFKEQDVKKASQHIKGEEHIYADKFTTNDLQDIAELLVEFIDAAISSGLRWWAKDTTDIGYALTVIRKRSLISILTKILVKHQVRFNLELIFILTLVAVYATPFKKARDNRRRVIKSETREFTNIKNNEQSHKSNSKEAPTRKRRGAPDK